MCKVFIKKMLLDSHNVDSHNVQHFYKVLLGWKFRISPVLTEYCKRLWNELVVHHW